MEILSRYGTARPSQIAAHLCALQSQFAPIAAPVAPPIEGQSYADRMQAHQIERTGLRIERAELREYLQTSDVCDELARIETRLSELDDYLIFETDFDFEATPYLPEYDEFDADLPDELDGSFAGVIC